MIAVTPWSLQSPTILYDDYQVRMHPVVRMRRMVPAIVGSESWHVNWPKPLNRSASIDIIRVTRRDRDSGEQTVLKKQRGWFRGVYVWGFNSTVIKHSDVLFWNNTSERVTPRCRSTATWQRVCYLPLYFSVFSTTWKLCQCNHWVLKFESITPAMNE